MNITRSVFYLFCCMVYSYTQAQNSLFSVGFRAYTMPTHTKTLELFYQDADSAMLNRKQKVGGFSPMVGLNVGWDINLNPSLYLKAIDAGFSLNTNRIQWYDYLGLGVKIPFGEDGKKWLKFQGAIGYHYNVFWFGTFAPEDYGWKIHVAKQTYEDTIQVKFKSHFLTFYPCLRVGAEIAKGVKIEGEAGYQLQLYEDSYLTFKVKDSQVWAILTPFTKTRLDIEHVYDANQKPLKTTPFSLNGWNVAIRILFSFNDI